MKTTLLSLLLLLPCAVRGQFILASNDLADVSSLCTDAHGALLTAANGYATAGTFSITDAQIAATALVPGGSATLAAGFQPFSGSTARVGDSGFSGIFELDGNSVTQASGLPIYVVVHNRATLAQSDEVLIYKSTAVTAAGGDPISSVNIALTHSTGDGTLILGVRSLLTASVPGYAENRPTLRLTMMQKLDYEGWAAQMFGANASPEIAAREADPDSDGCLNYEEWQNCLNPNNPDTDHDGIPDCRETPEGARNADQDGDGVNDGDEAAAGTNPRDPLSHVSMAENLANHWTFDAGEQDRLSCRRLQFTGTAAFTDSLRRGVVRSRWPSGSLPGAATPHRRPALCKCPACGRSLYRLPVGKSGSRALRGRCSMLVRVCPMDCAITLASCCGPVCGRNFSSMAWRRAVCRWASTPPVHHSFLEPPDRRISSTNCCSGTALRVVWK
jgi:Bacterial TSP3 repeat